MFKRIALMLAINILVVLTISFISTLLGLDRVVQDSYGINYQSLAIMCLLYGMSGSIISLMLSRWMAKFMYGVKLVEDDQEYRWLVQMIHQLARKANLPQMPQVGVYQSPEVNAFATGPTKSRSLVAVSSGLLQTMSHDEIEGVMAHEVAHIQNGDMVTMTLITGIMNAFVLFLSRILSYVVAKAMSKSEDSENGAQEPSLMMQFALRMVFEIVLMLLASIVINYFSRWREFKADAGSVKLSGTKSKMISALRALQRIHDQPNVFQDDRQAAVAALKISGRRGGFLSLLSTHPPLEARIKALEEARIHQA